MAGRPELVRRSLGAQDASLRVLSQLLSRFLYPSTQSSLEQQTGNVSSDASGDLRGPSGSTPSTFGLVRQFHGASGRFQQHAYEESESFDEAQEGEGSANRGGPAAASDGGGKGPDRDWRSFHFAGSDFMPRSLGDYQTTSQRGRSVEFHKGRQFVAPPDDRRGTVHWVEIDENGKYTARDPFGTEIDARLNEFLEAQREQLEAYRVKASHRRGIPVARTPVDKTWLRWPDQFQLSAVLGQSDSEDGVETSERIGQPDEASSSPESIPSTSGSPSANEDRASEEAADRRGDSEGTHPDLAPGDQPIQTLRRVEARLGQLLAAGRYESVEQEFAAHQYSCQVQFGNVKGHITAQMYTYVLLAFQHSKASFTRCLKLHKEMRSHGLVPGVLHYNTLLKVALDEKVPDAKAIVDVTEEMQELGVKPDSDTYNNAALACAWGKYSMSAYRYVEEMIANGMMPGEKTLHEVLICLIRFQGEGAKRTTEAGALIKFMLAQDVRAKTYSIQEVLNWCIDQDDCKTSSLCFKLLNRRDTLLDEGTLLAALNSAARSGDLELQQLAWDQMQRVVRVPSAGAHLARLQAMTAALPLNGGAMLEKLFQEMAQLEETFLRGKGAATLSAEDADTLFDPSKSFKWVVARLSRRLKALDQAYYTLTEMHEAGQRVPLSGLNSIIQGCVNVRDMSRAFQTFDEIQRTFRMEPDVHAYNAILYGCGHSREIAATVRTFEVMQAAGVMPNKRSWELLVMAHVINRTPAKALATLQDMFAKGFVPDRGVLDGLLRRSRRENYSLGEKTVLKLMEALGFKEDVAAKERLNKVWQMLGS